MARSKTKYETLNPAFYETLEMKIKLPKRILNSGEEEEDLENLPKSIINIMVFDEDIDPFMRNKKKSLLGRTILTVDPNRDKKQVRNMREENLNQNLKLEQAGLIGGILQVKYELVKDKKQAINEI